MRRISPSDLRFRIKRALQELTRSTIRDLVGKPDKREQALDVATEAVAERFAGCEVHEEESKRMDFADMTTSVRPDSAYGPAWEPPRRRS